MAAAAGVHGRISNRTAAERTQEWAQARPCRPAQAGCDPNATHTTHQHSPRRRSRRMDHMGSVAFDLS